MTTRPCFFCGFLILVMLTLPGVADSLLSLTEVEAVDEAIVGLHYEGVDYVVADGDLDLYVALRAGVNRLLQNNDGRFSDVTFQVGIAEPRRTVGACWFDFDRDGLPDYVATGWGSRDVTWKFGNGSGGIRFTGTGWPLVDKGRRPERGWGVGVGDLNADGIFNGSDAGLAGWTITAFAEIGVADSPF